MLKAENQAKNAAWLVMRLSYKYNDLKNIYMDIWVQVWF